jgi:hypothetical protein
MYSSLVGRVAHLGCEKEKEEEEDTMTLTTTVLVVEDQLLSKLSFAVTVVANSLLFSWLMLLLLLVLAIQTLNFSQRGIQ